MEIVGACTRSFKLFSKYIFAFNLGSLLLSHGTSEAERVADVFCVSHLRQLNDASCASGFTYRQ